MIQGETKTYKQNRLTFILSPEKIVVRTSLGQQFYLLPKAHYWRRRFMVIQTMIQLNEIRNLNELASFTNPGIDWVALDNTLFERKVPNYETIARV